METKGFCRAQPALHSIHQGDGNGDSGNARASFTTVSPTTGGGLRQAEELEDVAEKV